ncbi:MAG: outer membrane beta-barrel protein, partial [Tunicatimonas sp.]|uniref:outer membrane beta-barrel protein n=1 Tax=Tunicatimonas sp. TaxID=1940096 RepID=UPI003C717C31
PAKENRRSQAAQSPNENTLSTERSEVAIADENNQLPEANSSNGASITDRAATNGDQSSQIASESGNSSQFRTKQEAVTGSNVAIADVDKENAAVSAGSVAAEQSTAKTLIFPNEEVSPREEVLLSNHQVGRTPALPPGGLALNAPTWADGVNELYFVPQNRNEFAQESEKRGAQFFAGLAMAPSFFDPNFQSQPSGGAFSDFALMGESFSPPNFDMQTDNLFVARISNNSAGSSSAVEEGLQNQSSLSFSYGLNFGLELGEHWSIESGLDFQNFQTTTETRYTVVDLQSGKRYPLVATNAQANAASYSNTTPIGDPSGVDNQFQFVSIPLMIGYNVHFARFTVLVSPGVATNLFLGNRISSDQYASSTISRDGNSPFNTQYFSGIISGGVFYQLLRNYSLSFTPSYQFALTNLASNSATFSSQPQSLGLRLGFRYNFQ